MKYFNFINFITWINCFKVFILSFSYKILLLAITLKRFLFSWWFEKWKLTNTCILRMSRISSNHQWLWFNKNIRFLLLPHSLFLPKFAVKLNVDPDLLLLCRSFALVLISSFAKLKLSHIKDSCFIRMKIEGLWVL